MERNVILQRLRSVLVRMVLDLMCVRFHEYCEISNCKAAAEDVLRKKKKE